MSDIKRVEGYFDRTADAFDSIYSGKKPGVFRLWDRLTRRNIQERLEFSLHALAPLEGRRILDVGCGSGRYGIAFAGKGAHEVLGIDVSGRMLELARRLADEHGVAARCRFEQHSVVDFRPAQLFDDAVAMGFFDYLPEPLPAMQAVRKAVRDRVVASFPARSAVRVPFRMLWLRLRGCPVRFYDAREIVALCNAAQLEVVELVRRGPIFLLRARAR